MFETIVFPYDFSNFSEKVADFIIKMKDSGTKKVIIVSVIEYETLSVRPISKELEIQEYKRKTRERLIPLREMLEISGYEVSIYVEYGIPSKTIIETANREHANLIVMGALGSGISNSLLGSTAQNVIKISNIPVLVVPAK